jgi:hypothetical protein
MDDRDTGTTYSTGIRLEAIFWRMVYGLVNRKQVLLLKRVADLHGQDINNVQGQVLGDGLIKHRFAWLSKASSPSHRNTVTEIRGVTGKEKAALAMGRGLLPSLLPTPKKPGRSFPNAWATSCAGRVWGL